MDDLQQRINENNAEALKSAQRMLELDGDMIMKLATRIERLEKQVSQLAKKINDG